MLLHTMFQKCNKKEHIKSKICLFSIFHPQPNVNFIARWAKNEKGEGVLYKYQFNRQLMIDNAQHQKLNFKEEIRYCEFI